jgi:hypothetical protein
MALLGFSGYLFYFKTVTYMLHLREPEPVLKKIFKNHSFNRLNSNKVTQRIDYTNS